MSLRVLAVTSQFPWPLNSGGRIRTFHLLKSIGAVAKVRLICPVARSEDVPPDHGLVRAGVEVRAVPVGARKPLAEAMSAAAATARFEPYAMYRRHYWKSVAAAFHDELTSFKPSVVYLDHLDSFTYWSPSLAGTTRAVVDLHNVYSLIAQRLGEDQQNPFKRGLFQSQARLLKNMEQRVARSGQLLFTVSEDEAQVFRRLGAANVVVVPNGVDCSALESLPEGRPRSQEVMFIGSMSWGPNVEAARFLASEVLPEVRRQIPDARLAIVGANPPKDLLSFNSSPGIEVTGIVPDVKPYLERAALLAVPLNAGGGTRLKILEAFAAGLPVVSTAVGAEGIAATPGQHFVQASRHEFAEAVVSLLKDSTRGIQLATAARGLARSRYDWPRIGATATAALSGFAEHEAGR
jgi:glycosyltransferase involved in cell wall biosynthesis